MKISIAGNALALLINIIFVSGLFAQENKTYPPTKFPDRVILGYKTNPAVSQAVNWRTDSTVSNAVGAIHEADPSPDFVPNARIVKAKSLPVILDGKTVHYHEVNFTDLKPSTQYVYRVGGGQHWSEWFHFKTASDKQEPVSFLYFGDAQNDLRSLWSRTIRGAFATLPKANLMIHAGDLINRSNTDYEWGEWFEAGGWVNGMIPSLSSPGNHEYYKDKTIKRMFRTTGVRNLLYLKTGPRAYLKLHITLTTRAYVLFLLILRQLCSILLFWTDRLSGLRIRLKPIPIAGPS
ncbi:FN3 domain-containing metallophosphoesterase family protein [Dyadobacter sp. CY312]|uniref:FN3 domain-containing metallophosphoesterase family protein n=1 Tax=Dyadobacter sp. CY312 TaxID=2907303 RepID=UPI00286E2796|nr:FN3 domain-containing metallophosphoesterase family protein [Dyadobacter sp. CY312]